ncbi:Gfo/Idh/MocA family oxidoreductase [Paenibacillus filicis]|uniref:Gfo/Idh/MocA family oxidoreductase n=1 Tax=Paenibacillus gyeongsangnamensis TaxID=3388067 RepID=A0ABT4Q754_9BACL|nr:Gfo/Idh/MocA family oxidoreductase [Paenibacillus filicis]MCZ8512694.1 Gfo/Idh/MocA family oxidoreductase [Paenibacillus filicis]
MTLSLIQVGVGGFGRAWLKSIAAHPEYRMAALVDLSEEAVNEARTILQDQGIPAFGTLEEALGAVSADAVLIVTPPRTHVALALKALEAGLHVLTEKPLSYSIEEAMTLYEKRSVYGKQVVVNQNYRWSAPIGAVKRALDDGIIGDPAYVEWSFRRLHNVRRGTWRVSSPDILFTDVSVHHFDLMRYLLGSDPISVCAQGFRPSWTWCEGSMVNGAFFEFPGGIRVNYFGSLEETGSLTPWNGNFRITGSEGAVELTEDVPYVVRRDGSREELALPDGTAESKKVTLDMFKDAVLEGTKAATDITDNIRTFLMVSGAIESARTQRWVTYRFPESAGAGEAAVSGAESE